MGRRGPKAKPANVKSQKEPVRSKRKKAAAAAAPVIADSNNAAPDWLKGEGLSIYRKLGPRLRDAKLLTAADVPAFARYCKHYARWIDLQKRLDKNGDIYEIETASGMVRRADPAFVMADRLDRMMLAIEDRFGLNPAERQRIFAARASTGSTSDLFGADKPDRKDDPAAAATPPAEPTEGPIGLLN